LKNTNGNAERVIEFVQAEISNEFNVEMLVPNT